MIKILIDHEKIDQIKEGIEEVLYKRIISRRAYIGYLFFIKNLHPSEEPEVYREFKKWSWWSIRHYFGIYLRTKDRSRIKHTTPDLWTFKDLFL